ncbi:MAG: hypothetical protein H7Y22_05190 [Gemmatimonadaceae bacterium]|nr:hypothetical protein [Gloeobacterales cyanobacterium ES-bin-141]
MNAPEPDSIQAALDVIDHMVALRGQMAEVEAQIKSLQPAFHLACTVLETERIETSRAVITKRHTPGQWTYPASILLSEEQLKQLKKQFQKDNEPTSGREVIWAVKLMGIDPAE